MLHSLLRQDEAELKNCLVPDYHPPAGTGNRSPA